MKGIGKAKGIGRAIVYFIMYFVLTAVFQFLLSAVFAAIAASNGLTKEALITQYVNNNFLGITIASGILTGLSLYLFFAVRKRQVKQEWKLNKFKIKDAALASVVSFSFSFIFALVTYNVPPENSLMISKSVAFYSEMFPMFGMIMMAINLLIIAPITEEIALRGIVYTRVEKTTNAITAIIVSSVLFGLMHLLAGGIALVIGAMCMAIVLGCIYKNFNSLWVCIIAHAAANLPDFILYNRPKISGRVFWGLIAFCALLFIVGVYAIQKSASKNGKNNLSID